MTLKVVGTSRIWSHCRKAGEWSSREQRNETEREQKTVGGGEEEIKKLRKRTRGHFSFHLSAD